MKLKLKEEYKEWSFGGGRTIKTELKNLDPSLYEYYFLNGYSEFFEEEKVKKEIQNNKDIENDINK